MNINMDDVRKEKIWEELLSELDKHQIRPEERTIKMIMEEKHIAYDTARDFLGNKEKEGILVMRRGRCNEKIYSPV